MYAEFLMALDDVDVRAKLSLPNSEGEETAEYKALSDKARRFHDCGFELLKERFSNGNPTLSALVL